ncbi:MAG: Crp/Fnr family transcriptional regulator [Hyphomicrobiaceae bacterium]
MTKPNDILAQLGRTALFGPVPEADRARVAREMRSIVFDRGKRIFSRGEAGGDVYLVISGRVRLSVYSGEGKEFAFLNAGPGEIFGEIAALDGGCRTTDARALARVEAMVLPRAALQRLIETVPSIAVAAIAFLCTRLRATNETVEAVALHRLEVRIARFLMSAIKLRGAPPESGTITFDIGISQTEIALLIGASRPKVNLALQALETEGAIKRDGNVFTCDIAKLAEIADLDG